MAGAWRGALVLAVAASLAIAAGAPAPAQSRAPRQHPVATHVHAAERVAEVVTLATGVPFLTPDAMEHFFWALTSNPLTPVPGAPAGLNPAAYLIFAAIPGFFVGFNCMLLGGCPIRQTVMASEGSYKAGFFFIGMCVGSVIFAAFVSGWVDVLMRAIGFGA